MTRYLLDTNILSELVRDPRGRVAERVRGVGETSVCTSIVVAAELRYGALRRGSARLSAQCEAVLGALDVLPFDRPADRVYADVRVALERIGAPIGGNDLLIAAHAVALGHTLVTDNTGEFGRIARLRVENWGLRK